MPLSVPLPHYRASPSSSLSSPSRFRCTDGDLVRETATVTTNKGANVPFRGALRTSLPTRAFALPLPALVAWERPRSIFDPLNPLSPGLVGWNPIGQLSGAAVPFRREVTPTRAPPRCFCACGGHFFRVPETILCQKIFL